MKIKQIIYLAAAGAGAASLFIGPSLLGREWGLALAFPLLLFGLYGLSRGISTDKTTDSDAFRE